MRMDLGCVYVLMATCLRVCACGDLIRDLRGGGDMIEKHQLQLATSFADNWQRMKVASNIGRRLSANWYRAHASWARGVVGLVVSRKQEARSRKQMGTSSSGRGW